MSYVRRLNNNLLQNVLIENAIYPDEENIFFHTHYYQYQQCNSDVQKQPGDKY